MATQVVKRLSMRRTYSALYYEGGSIPRWRRPDSLLIVALHARAADAAPTANAGELICRNQLIVNGMQGCVCGMYNFALKKAPEVRIL